MLSSTRVSTTQTTETMVSTTQTTGTQADPVLLPGGGELSYQEVLDHFPVNVFRTVNESYPLFNPVYPPVQSTRLPNLMTRFDLVFGLEDTTMGWEDVPPQAFDQIPDVFAIKTVLVSPLHVQEFLNECDLYLGDYRRDRVLVVGVLEVPLSASFGNTSDAREEVVARLRRHFSRIWYFSTDAATMGVTTLPLGFFEPYMRNRTGQFLEAYRDASIDDSFKTGSVLAAWGVYTQKDGSKIIQPPEPDPLGYGSTEWTAVANAALDTRNDAEAWLNSSQADGVDVDIRLIAGDVWFSELSRYRFLLSPMGTAIQCSRLVEALVMMTIPIIMRGPFQTHDDLLHLGFPIVVVDTWAEITPESLKQWWEDLSPGLEAFRRECITSDGFWQIITTGRCGDRSPSGHMSLHPVRILASGLVARVP
jgi:hypothetical protein